MRRLLEYVLAIIMFITNPICLMLIYCNISRFDAIWLCIGIVLFIANFAMFVIVAKTIAKYDNKSV